MIGENLIREALAAPVLPLALLLTSDISGSGPGTD